MLGPPRMTLTITQGTSATQANPRFSCIRENPGPLVAVMALPVLHAFKRDMDPRAYNGATLLGLNGIIIKSHGSADVFGYQQAILRAVDEVRGGLLRRIAEQIDTYNATHGQMEGVTA